MVKFSAALVVLVALSLQPGAVPSTVAGAYITTVAGTGVMGPGGDGGPAGAAQLASPYDTALDSAGNLYVSEYIGCRVRKVTAATGTITTIAGTGACGWSGDSGPATSIRINHPQGIAVDAAGNVYIASDWRIWKVTAATGIMNAIVTIPNGVSDVDLDASGALYVVSPLNHSVYKVVVGSTPSPTWTVEAFAGKGEHWAGFSGDGGPATDAQLKWPERATVDAFGNVYIADTLNCRVRRVDGSTGIITTVAGHGICAFAGDEGPATAAALNRPTGIDVDRSTGDVYFADTSNNRVRKIAASTGIITTLAGTGSAGYGGDDGLATAARVNQPNGVTFVSDGRLYVADTSNHRVRKVTIVNDDVPFASDMDADGRADLVLWRPGTGTWMWLTSSSSYAYAAAGSRQWGSKPEGDVPLVADLDGDRKSDLIVWRPSTGTWYWLTSSSGYGYGAAGSRQFGDPSLGDTPLLGDIDGDGRSDLIIWRARTGTWYWLLASTGYDPAAMESKQWGNETYGDLPLVADMDGDGKSDLIVWRQTTGWWWATTGVWFWLTSSTGSDYASAGLRQWGSSPWRDRPLPADIDGDAKADLIVWRSLEGMWYWLRSAAAYEYPDADLRQWGQTSTAVGDTPLVGDMDGDGRTDLAVWRASTGRWYWLTSASGHDYEAFFSIQWGSTRP